LSYLKNIYAAVASSLIGMALTIKYFFDARKKRPKEYLKDKEYFDKTDGTFTVQYPYEEIPLPDNGRHKLLNEIDDCIVCDKCAKICPVDCIDIEPVKATETFGHASDGTPLRIYPAKFDIDMGKCCFCGLCTVVCPTECLTMTKDFDFSTDNILDHNFSFSKMTEQEIIEKKNELEVAQAAKQQATTQASLETEVKPKPAVKPSIPGAKKPVFKPRVVAKPKITPSASEEAKNAPKPKPVMKPKIKPVVKPSSESTDSSKPKSDLPQKATPKKPVIKPRIPPKKS